MNFTPKRQKIKVQTVTGLMKLCWKIDCKVNTANSTVICSLVLENKIKKLTITICTSIIDISVITTRFHIAKLLYI